MAPFYGLSGANAEVTLQVGYSIADIAAKCGYGLLIYNIARLRSEEEGYELAVRHDNPPKKSTT